MTCQKCNEDISDRHNNPKQSKLLKFSAMLDCSKPICNACLNHVRAGADKVAGRSKAALSALVQSGKLTAVESYVVKDAISEVSRTDEKISALMRNLQLLSDQRSEIQALVDAATVKLEQAEASEYEERRREADRAISDLNIRKMVFEKCNHKCVHCGSGELLTVDHIYPVKRGGGSDFRNLQALCRSCNSSKGARLVF